MGDTMADFSFEASEVLTQRELACLALEQCGLELLEEGLAPHSLFSNVLATFPLTLGVLARLQVRGFEFVHQADGTRTLVDRGSAWDSDTSWSFKPRNGDEESDLQVTARVVCYADESRRGMVLAPRVQATLASAGCPYPNQRLFCALAEMHADTISDTMHGIARHMIRHRLNYVVPWSDLRGGEGLCGIRSLPALFSEFMGRFARHRCLIDKLDANGFFSPEARKVHPDMPGALFVLEQAQPRVFQAWEAQLEECRRSLHLEP